MMPVIERLLGLNSTFWTSLVWACWMNSEYVNFASLFPLVVIVLLVWLASQTRRTITTSGKSEAKFTYSEFIQHAQTNDVQNVEFNPSKRSITGIIPSDGDKKFTVHYPADQSIPQL